MAQVYNTYQVSYACNHDKRDAVKVSGINSCKFFAAARSQASIVEEVLTLNLKVVGSNLGHGPHGKYFFSSFFGSICLSDKGMTLHFKSSW